MVSRQNVESPMGSLTVSCQFVYTGEIPLRFRGSIDRLLKEFSRGFPVSFLARPQRGTQVAQKLRYVQMLWTQSAADAGSRTRGAGLPPRNDSGVRSQ